MPICSESASFRCARSVTDRGRNREVTSWCGFIAEVRSFLPAEFHAPSWNQEVVAVVGALRETDVVKDEEFRFRPKVDGVSDSSRVEVFRPLCDVARITGVGLPGTGPSRYK